MAVLTPVQLVYPFTREKIAPLRVGTPLLISGRIFTGRDRLHRYLAEGGKCPVALRDGALYHCGPVMRRDGARWIVVAAGPTTSIREEPYMAKIIAALGVRLIIGKGGMGPQTLEACRQHGCIYAQAVGGAAQVLAARVREVREGGFVKEFGIAEGLWELEVDAFPALVTMDATGHSLYARVARASRRAYRALTAPAESVTAAGHG